MNSKHWAILATISYVVGIAAVMMWCVVDIAPVQEKSAELFIELVEPEPEPPVKPAAPQSRPAPEPEYTVNHTETAETNSMQEYQGEEPKTQTVNERALFKMNRGDSQVAEQNAVPQAEVADKEQARGSAQGLNPIGTDALDAGLQGRGLAGELPMPVYPGGNRGGKVVIRVAVNRDGNVTSATYEPKGSTTSDSALVEAAIAAAKRAKFTESAAFVQGGTITYIFKLKAN